MQDIVFYVAANETLGKVRDYSNMRNSAAPLLTLGVAVCLRIRLFEDVEVSTPYPIASFSGITDWKWRMDDDFDRSTPCKLVADADGITVHTVTDTINGKIVSFTEVVIPISNMNTRELVAWLGNNKVKTGLVGELVGYDNEGHPAFVLQIEDFSVRNRLAGLNEEDEDDPTPVDQEIVTRPMAEQMIQMAVSASAATKQDKLTSENAGTGISITGAGVISTANVPQSAVTGLSASLNSKQDKLTSENAGTGISVSNNGVISAANIPQSAVTGLDLALDYKQNTLSAGFWTEIDDDWISVERYHMIHGPFSRGTVSMQAGEAYRIYATTSAVTLGVGNIPDNTWGLEGHAEIFVASTGYVVTGSNVVLADPLVPDAVNNCTVRFHDGLAIISVEDHIAGYVVISATGTTAGTLPYAVNTAAQEYVAFDASLNGTTIPLSGAVANGEKHIVGNGYTETAITGAVDCGTSKFTVANLSLDDVQVTGGTMTLGDAYIPSGSTVAVSGGGLAVEKVTGAGSTSVIDLGGTNVNVSFGVTASAAGCVFTKGGGGSDGYGGAISVRGSRKLVVNNCIISGNNARSRGGAIYNAGNLDISNSVITGNRAPLGAGLDLNAATSVTHISGSTIADNYNLINPPLKKDILLYGGHIMYIDGGCTMGVIDMGTSATLNISGSNTFVDYVSGTSPDAVVTLASGATLDLTGNTNATPIAPGGGITFASGGATVKVGDATASSSYMMDNVKLSAGAKLTNTNVVDLGQTGIEITSKTTVAIDGVSIQNGYGYFAPILNRGSLYMSNCKLSPGDYGDGGMGCGLAVNGYSATPAYAKLTAVKTYPTSSAKPLLFYINRGTVDMESGCDIDSCRVNIQQRGEITMRGSNSFRGRIMTFGDGGIVNLTSGAILDLTGNTIATPIDPGGGVIVDDGCQVITSAGTTVSIAGGTYTKINNDGTTE